MTKVEICCGSYEDCIRADQNGADRVELNSALFLGGLTPSAGTVEKVLAKCRIPVICMVRPRGAGFCYSPDEKEIMFTDAKIMLDMGCQGIAFGFLNPDRSIDYESTKKMIDLIHSYPSRREAVFHRAVDCVANVDRAMQSLIEFGCDRVLTSGGKNTALEGMDRIKYLQNEYGNQIQILAGSGINKDNVIALLAETQISQVHSSAKVWHDDPTTKTDDVSYAYHDDFDYDVVSPLKVAELVRTVNYK